MTDQFAAGWYSDPAGTRRLRYFDGHAWTEQYAALTPAAWAPPQTSSMPIAPQERTWWKRKRMLIPIAAISIVVINAANTPKSNRVASPATTIATQVLAAEVTSTVVASSSTTAVIPTTATSPAPTVAPTIATTSATPAATEPPQVFPIAAPIDTEPPVAESEPSTTGRTTAPTTARVASVFFNNCAEARAAGAAPLHRGDPGYRPELDRDKDGTACE